MVSKDADLSQTGASSRYRFPKQKPDNQNQATTASIRLMMLLTLRTSHNGLERARSCGYPASKPNSCTACFSSDGYCCVTVRQVWALTAAAETLDQIRTKTTCSNRKYVFKPAAYAT